MSDTQLSQRQDERVTRWKAPGDVFQPQRYDVAWIDDDAVAKAFVQRHHYSGSYPAAVHRFGLYERSAGLVGVAVYSTGTNPRTITNVFGDALVPWHEAFELGRFVLRDAVPYNAETWLLARCHEQLARAGVRGVVSFSDPYPRRQLDGRIVFTGHVGTIYQAGNALYTGRATRRRVRVLPDGRIFSDRAQQKIRKCESGWEASVRTLEAYGAPALEGSPRDWLKRALEAVTRPLSHPGNHRYVFQLGRNAPPVLLAPVDRPRTADRDRP